VSLLPDARRAAIDQVLAEDADHRGVWFEDGPYGGTVVMRLDAEHLRKVLLARPAFMASKPKLRLVLPGLRLVKPAKKETAA